MSSLGCDGCRLCSLGGGARAQTNRAEAGVDIAFHWADGILSPGGSRSHPFMPDTV